MKTSPFTAPETKLIAGIGMVLGLRMLGVSLIIPVFSIYATTISGATGTLAGFAVGVFAIMQTVLQVPFGRLSDRWGRKATTLIGLGFYLAGSVISGLAGNIFQLIIGRGIAGIGAVSGVTMAWLTDGIDAGRRNAALAYVGISIGLSVILGFTLSPLIAGSLGIPFLFYLSAGIILILIIYIAVSMRDHDPSDGREPAAAPARGASFLMNGDLIRLNLSGFIVNLAMTAMFFVLPVLINREMPVAAMWRLYVPMALIGTLGMYVISRLADTRGTPVIAVIAFSLILAGTIIPVFADTLASGIIAFITFYAGYCILSPVLPAAVSRYPGRELRGTTLGMFNSSQFIGSGLGGFAGGWMIDALGARPLFITLSVLALAGLILMAGFRDYADITVRP